MNAIFLDNDFEPEYTVTVKAAATGVETAATGLTGLTFRISATQSGSALGSLTENASERGALGIYYAVFDGDQLRTDLAAYAGQKVWLVFGDGTNVLVNDRLIVRPYRWSDGP